MFSCFSTILAVDRPSSYQVSCFLTCHSVLAQNCSHITSLGLATCMNQFSGLGTWAMADAESDTGWNKPLWSSLKFPQRSAPQSPFPGLHGHLCCRHLSNLSRRWLGGRWRPHCFLCWDRERFPKQSAWQCQVCASPAAPDNGTRGGSSHRRRALPSQRTTQCIHPKDASG